MTAISEQIQQIYIGLLGRAADKPGLEYWQDEIDGGVLTIEQLRANIVNEQPEYAAGLGSQTREEVVAALYENLFERAPEAEGLEYWVNGGGSSVNADQLVLALINGAADADRDNMLAKVSAAQSYTLASGGNYDPDAARAAVEDVASALINGSLQDFLQDNLVSDLNDALNGLIGGGTEVGIAGEVDSGAMVDLFGG